MSSIPCGNAPKIILDIRRVLGTVVEMRTSVVLLAFFLFGIIEKYVCLGDLILKDIKITVLTYVRLLTYPRCQMDLSTDVTEHGE